MYEVNLLLQVVSLILLKNVMQRLNFTSGKILQCRLYVNVLMMKLDTEAAIKPDIGLLNI